MASEIVNVHAAKTNLSRLLERVEAGEEIVWPGRQADRAPRRRTSRTQRKRWFGATKGEIKILPGFDELDDGDRRDFEESVPLATTEP